MLAIIPATVYGYTMQNGLNLFRSLNSSAINSALNTQEIVPAAMRFGDYLQNWHTQHSKCRNALVFACASYSCISSAALFFKVICVLMKTWVWMDLVHSMSWGIGYLQQLLP